MKFERLQASISNNADQSPSLYMALCAVESLFADLEDNCGSEVSQCPIGDERLPSKLVWLCRIINEIYRDKDDELQRNRSRLDAAMEKLKETQRKLEDSSAVADRLESLQAEYAALEQQLESSGVAAKKCEVLAQQCLQARQKLEQLKTFDPQAAHEELMRLNGEITAQEAAKAELQAQLTKADECVAELQQEVSRLQTKEQDMRQQYMALQAQKKETQGETARLREDMGTLEEELVVSKAQWQQLVSQRDELQQQIDLLREKSTLFREEDLVTKHAELELLQKELAQLENDQDGYKQTCTRIKEQRNQLVMEVAYMKAETQSLQEKLELAQQKREGMEQEKSCLTANLTDCLTALEVLQTEVDQLTGTKIPEAQALQEQERQRSAQLQQALQLAEDQLVAMKAEIEAMNESLPKLEEEVKNNRVVYDALTASCAASSSELENLERQIAELRNNSDEQKLMIYRKQLEENQRELENMQLECEQIKEQTVQLGEKLELLQNERAKLRDLKSRHEQGVEVTEKQLRELEFVTDEQYVHEVIALNARAKLLETVRGKLVASIANMQKILGYAPPEETMVLEDQMKQVLRDLGQRTDDLRGALVECAKSLKMEER